MPTFPGDATSHVVMVPRDGKRLNYARGNGVHSRTLSRQEIAMALLDGKVAIITGASKGIGRALSLRFAEEHAAVICAARSADLVRETADLVTKAGGRAIAVTCDAAKEDDVKRMIEAGVKAFGRITTLVNNAGDGGPTKPVQDYTMDDWLYTLHSCLTSSYVCTRFAVPEMLKAGGGSIVNISSGAGRRGLPFRIGYCSAKAGQVGMTYGMARELAPEIRVNCVAPGAVEGDRIDSVIAGQARVRGISVEEMRQSMIDRNPLKRFVTADDIVDATVFFASDMARSISGQVLAVNAGEPNG
jgi:NAD(P)-dependent dehydrogenase (short-subunit alcohol dehydrogenase family)